MISFFHGPGGFRQRLLAELVPAWIGMLAWFFVSAFVPFVVAAVLGLPVWAAASWLLRRVRQNPQWVRLYRLALAAHFLFWGVLGVMGSGVPEAYSTGEPVVTSWVKPQAVRVGAATVPFELPPHTTLAGWGARPRRLAIPATAGLGLIGRVTHDLMRFRGSGGAPWKPLFREAEAGGDELGVRAFVLRPETDGGQDAPVARVSLDVVSVERKLVEAVLSEVEALGYRRETLLIGATHTHSGPGKYSEQRLSELAGTDHYDERVFEALRDATIKAIRQAHAGAIPDTLDYRLQEDRGFLGSPFLVRNRRSKDPIDVDRRIAFLGGSRGGVVNCAIHPVVYRRRNMQWRRDVPGGIATAWDDFVEQPYSLAFLQGASADVTPNTTRVPPTLGVKYLGQRVAWRLATVMEREVQVRAPVLRVRAARVPLDLGTPHVVAAVGNRDSLVRRRGGLFRGGFTAILADLMALPVNVVIWGSGYTDGRVLLDTDAVGAIVNMSRYVDESALGVGIIDLELFDAANEAKPKERIRIMWTPAEATTNQGRRWRAGQGEHMLVGFANGMWGYVVTDKQYAGAGYESVAALYGPEAGRRIGAALKACDEALR